MQTVQINSDLIEALTKARFWVAREAGRSPTQQAGMDRLLAAQKDLRAIDAALIAARSEQVSA